MQGKRGGGLLVLAALCAGALAVLLSASVARGQGPAKAAVDAGSAAASSSATGPAASRASDVQALADAVRALEQQVQTLNSQIGDLKAQQETSREEVETLRKQLEAARQGPAAGAADSTSASAAPMAAAQAEAAASAAPGSDAAGQQASVEDRLAKLEDDVEYANEKINDQAQTKVESASKYRVRLSGIVLANLFGERGTVDSVDVPEVAMTPSRVDSKGAFGGTLRQSQLGLEAFGPEIAGARTSANIRFDFAGGFPNNQNGAEMGLVRLRTGTIRLDWEHTSVIAGQDNFFLSPLTPSSLASLSVPALSYVGNLWAWTPQIRIEHRFEISENSKVAVDAGILDSLSGDVPRDQTERYPNWGEQAGQPAYAAHFGWTRRAFGQDLSIGVGGLYARQSWGFGRDVDAWAGTADVNLPLGSWVAFRGEFYRGRALGGFGGGIGQTILLSGSFINPATAVAGLDSMGGWAQLKFKITPMLEINTAIGDDSPFAGEIRRFPGSSSYYGPSFVRNWSPLVNFIYQPKSDILFSTEYRRLESSPLDAAPHTANLVNLSVGYLF
ncbi:MAG TPA: hypothetical protein VN661_07115 [Candidatus Acidoferrales bacterium]|nr:hypothetical protein [Candidatus Acidoferrales bacterium]